MIRPFGGLLWELYVLEVEPAAGRAMQPFGTPGVRHSGAAFASVEKDGVISIAMKAVDKRKSIDNNRRTASSSNGSRAA